ncbi:MAG TPA: GGDEF domain-containing protein [Sphingomonadaceae bacterium]|nr:GGDEF domain-containing protein [Sphingomonadaceae bacterium]
MGMDFTPRENRALYGMLASDTNDIVFKLDREGYVQHASPAIDRLGLPFNSMLIGPHLLDLVDRDHAEPVERELRAALAGRPSGRWVELRTACDTGPGHWFELRLRSLCRADDQVYGALGVMRSIAERKSLEDQLFASELTDPLTGLSNRRAFLAMLQHLVEARSDGCVALFGIDNFNAINMRYGQGVGDRVLMVFSDLLRALMRQDDIISRIGDECLGVLLPSSDPKRARKICRRIVETLSETRQELRNGNLTITASAGVSRIGASLDYTMQRAQLALFMAKAKGRNRLEVDETVGRGEATGGPACVRAIPRGDTNRRSA